MDLENKVSTIMTKKVYTLNPNDKLKAARDLFASHSLHHIPIVNDGELVGLLSKMDYLYFLRPIDEEMRNRYINDTRLEKYKIKEVMTDQVITISSKDTIRKALETISEFNLFHCLPVVDDGKLVGILTTHDIVMNLLNA